MKDKIEEIIHKNLNGDYVAIMNAANEIQSLLHSALEEQKRICYDTFLIEIGHSHNASLNPEKAILNAPFPEGIEINDGWVSIKDRVPEESMECLIFTEANSIYVSHYKKHRNMFTAYGVQSVLITDIKTTHWRPLPNPPKVK